MNDSIKKRLKSFQDFIYLHMKCMKSSIAKSLDQGVPIRVCHTIEKLVGKKTIFDSLGEHYRCEFEILLIVKP